MHSSSKHNDLLDVSRLPSSRNFGLPKLCRPAFWNFILILSVVMIFLLPTVFSREIELDKEKSHLVTNAEWTRKKAKNSECRLGGSRYALNSTWNPDLGPPFGVWNCVRCTCTPIKKKRRVVAKVICKNFKTECPQEHKCKKPVLHPGACCKICVDEGNDTPSDFVQEEEINELESLAEKDFAVLLNGRTSINPVTTKRLATGRIFLRRGNLHFSFVKDPNTPSPSTIEFMDAEGNVLEELESQPTPYETNNGRICGTWTRVPRQYRKLLLKEMLWVALSFEGEEDSISGRIARYKGVDTEVFSSLLAPQHENANPEGLPAGGTAIISVSAPSDSLHVSLVFNGIFASSDERNVSLVVELLPSRALEPVQDIVLLQKVFSDINEADVLTTLGETSLRLLARGKVSMRIWSTSAPDLVLEGAVTSRATCNVFYSVLTSSPRVAQGQGQGPNYGSGWGLLFLTNDGDFKYQIRLQNLPGLVEGVVLDTEGRRKVRQVEDVTHALSEGWVNGTYTKPTYRDLDALLRGRLRASVLLVGGATLDGVFDAVSVTEALRVVYPTLLTSPTTWLAATSWVAVDEDCVMHYDIRLGGADPTGGYDPTWSLHLRENDTLWDPRLDQENVTLEQIVSGREIAAHTVHLSKISLSRLHNGVSFLDLAVSSSKTEFSPTIVLTAPMKDVVVPAPCLLNGGGGGVWEGKKPEQGIQVDSPCKGFVCLDEEIPPVVSKKCIDDKKKVYEDGTTWKSPVNNCARCMCTLGTIKCEDEPCPKPSCADAVVLPGQCCPSCQVVSGRLSERVCEMDDDFHIIGAFWHPFLAPNGFDKCVTCYCNITWKSSPVVECSRASCPRLNCHESEAKFAENSCCPVCPLTTPAPPGSLAPTVHGMFSEGALPLSDTLNRAEVLANGGCVERKIFSSQKFLHPNGDVWFPKLSPNGVSRCVSCTCKDGNISCEGMECPEEQKCKKGKKCRTRKAKFRKPKPFAKYSTDLHHKKKSKRKEKMNW